MNITNKYCVKSAKIINYYLQKYSRLLIEELASGDTYTTTGCNNNINNYYSLVLPSLISKYFDNELLSDHKLFMYLSRQDQQLLDNGYICLFAECKNATYFETQHCLKRHLISHHYEEIPGGGVFMLEDLPFDRFICRKCCERFFNHRMFKSHLVICRQLGLFENESNENILMIRYTDDWHTMFDIFMGE